MWGRKRKPQVQQRLKFAKMSMDSRETFVSHLYPYFPEIGDAVWDDFTMEALQLVQKYKDLQVQQQQQRQQQQQLQKQQQQQFHPSASGVYNQPTNQGKNS